MSVQILHGDCREIMRTLPDASIDLVIADPPYGDTNCDWDKQVDGWLTELPRLLKPSGSLWCFGSMRFFVDRLIELRQSAIDVAISRISGDAPLLNQSESA